MGNKEMMILDGIYEIDIFRACNYLTLYFQIYNIYSLSLEYNMQDQKQTKKRYRLKSNNSEANGSVISSSSTVKVTQEGATEHFQVHDLQAFVNKEMEYPFQYNFNEYLRLFLIKVLPPKEKDIKIDCKLKKLSGPSNLCEPFIAKIKQQFASYCMKVIKFKANADIEQIEFELEKSYDIKIFKKKYMLLTVRDIIKTYGLKEDALSFQGKLSSGQLILARIKKICQSQCLKEMNELMSNLTPKPSAPRSALNKSQSFIALPSQKIQPIVHFQRKEDSDPSVSNSSSSEEIIEDNESTYYQSESFKKSNINRNSQNYSTMNNAGTKKPSIPPQFADSLIYDSVSVRGEKMKMKKEREVEQYRPSHNFKKQDKQQQPKYQLIKEYEYQSFDQKQFLKWLKSQKKIRRQNIIIQSETDPYADNQQQYKIYKIRLVKYHNDEFQSYDIQEHLELYLKFKKVIMINIKNKKYKEDLMKEYEKNEEELRIEYIEGYKSPKWSEAQMWKHIGKKDYTPTKMAGNSEYFQLFYLQGVKTIVQDFEKEIKNKLNNEPKDDEPQELLIELPEIADYLRGTSNSNIKTIVLDYFNEMMKSNFTHCCYLENSGIVLGKVKLELKVKCEQVQQFQAITKNKIIEKALREIGICQYQSTIKIDHKISQRLNKIIPTKISKQQQKIRFIRTIYNGQKFLNELTKFFNSLTKISEKQIKIQDKMIFNNIEKNLDTYISINASFIDIKRTVHSEQMKIKLYGSEHLIQEFSELINSSIAELQSSKISYYQIIKQKEAEVLKENDLFEDIYKKYDIWINTEKQQIPCKIIISNPKQSQKRKTVLYIKSKSLNYAPFGSVIAFRSNAQIQLYKKDCFLKTFKNYTTKSNKHDIFQEQTRKLKLLLKNGSTVSEIMKEALGVNPNPSNCIVLIAPQKNKKAYMKEVLQILQNKDNEKREITVMIIEYGLATDAYDAVGIQPYVKGKKLRLKDQIISKYYVQDKGMKYYYSEGGNKKIVTARQQGLDKFILNNEDLNITHLSHRFETATNSIIHHQSTKRFPITILPYNRLQYEINKEKYQIPIKQSAAILKCIQNKLPFVDLSLGVYEIDLKNLTQKNMFSDYSRILCRQDTTIKANLNEQHVQAYYNVKMIKIQYSYSLEKNLTANLQSAVEELANLLSKKEIARDVSFQDFGNINLTSLQNIKSTIEEDEYTQCFFDEIDKKISFRTLDEVTAKRCEKMINLLLTSSKEKDSIKTEYPLTWSPQVQDIETFQVMPNTPEFNNVQAKFTVSKIRTLIRIQNKIIFNKYFQEKKFLENMTGKTIKTMQLFHGTRTVNPQQIYRDKEESFNINYSSDNNLLGKGIYFAERSQYSNDYRHTEIVARTLFANTNTYSMFLCQVLVGQSQKCPGHSGAIKDTSYKDAANKIRYESMTDFLNNSNIYVVYKSRRAYPLYLIKY